MEAVTDQKSKKKVTKPAKGSYTKDPTIWRQRYNLAYRKQEPRFHKWREWYDLMYGIKNYQNMGPWRSKVFIPIMSYKAWTIIAKLLSMRPGFAVKMYDKVYSRADALKIEKANLKLEYDYDNPMLDETIRDRMFDPLTDAVVCGTGFAFVGWTEETRTKYSHYYNEDDTIDYEKAEAEDVDYGYNDLQPLNNFDVFGAPGKRSWQKKPWIIVHDTQTREELLSDGLYSESEINKLKPSSANRDSITQLKQSKDQFLNDPSENEEHADDTVDTFDRYRCYERTVNGIHVCHFLEASTSAKGGDDKRTAWKRVREEKLPYWHDKYPIVQFYIRRKPHQAYGESIFEVTESMASGYNDIFNQFADSLAVVGNGGILMHEAGTTIHDFFYGPGGEVRYTGTKPEFEVPKSPDIQFFQMMLGLLEKGVEWGSVSSYAGGAPSDSSDKTQGTAEGIQRLQEAAGEIVTFMKSNFMQSVKQIGYMWLCNNRQFMAEPMVFEIRQRGKVTHPTVERTDFTDSMVMTIDEASMQPATKQERITATTEYWNTMFGIGKASSEQSQLDQGQTQPIRWNFQEIVADVSEEYGKADYKQFILGEDQEAQDNGEVVAGVRKMIEDGELDPRIGQRIIDEIEQSQQAIQQIMPQGDQSDAASTDEAGATGLPNPATAVSGS